MSTLIKVQHKGQVTIPTHLRMKAGINQGDMMEASFHQGRIILVPKVVIDRSKFPTADDEYTPAQRKAIDRKLAKADNDIKAGRLLGPFKTAEEMIQFLHGRTSNGPIKRGKKSKK